MGNIESEEQNEKNVENEENVESDEETDSYMKLQCKICDKKVQGILFIEYTKCHGCDSYDISYICNNCCE